MWVGELNTLLLLENQRVKVMKKSGFTPAKSFHEASIVV